jgi:transcriptional regulator with XRE-family HTH domain
MSQADLARAIGVPANTISRWETGTYKQSLENIDNLARFFGVPISQMFPEKVDMPGYATVLLSALDGMTKGDIREVISYALFRRATAKQKN